MMAAEKGHLECVSILVANGANVNGASEVIPLAGINFNNGTY